MSETASARSRWQREPFRVFFPLAILVGWVGIGHWLLYALGVTTSYSCLFHGMLQMQGFMMSFAVGFLLTAVPRRTGSAAPSALEMTVAGGLLVVTTTGALAEAWLVAEIAYAGIFVFLLQFALRRFVSDGGTRRPPAGFVLIPIGAAQGLAGAASIIASTRPGAPAWAMGLGRLLIEQGVFLCFAIGIGSLVLPLMAGAPPPPDLGSSPRERRRALAFAAGGLVIFVSLLLEQAGWMRLAPLARAAIVATGLGLGAGAWRGPGKPGFHRRLVWLSAWLMPTGLVATALWPDYRVPALHILFIGGFSLMAFSVATHVTLAHLGLDDPVRSHAPVIAGLGILLILAMLARLAADMSQSYFDHLGWAAGCWLAGSALWLGYFGPKLLRR